MKNYVLIIFIMLLIVPMAYAGFYTDTSRNYFTQKCYSGGIGNCFSEGGYMLNNFQDDYLTKSYNTQYPNNSDSYINYQNSGWDSCNLVLGGSKFRGLPFKYDDPFSNYSYSSFIRLRNYGNTSYIEQINSNCQVFDYWPNSENSSIVSQLGMINKGTEDGILPMFAFAWNNSNDGNVYMRVFTLDQTGGDANLFEYLDDFFIADWEEFGHYDDNLGVAGGSYYSDDNNPDAQDRVFGIYSKTFDSLFILYGKSTYPYFDRSEIVDIPQFEDVSTNHQLFYDDWDQDGNNEFILLSIHNKARLNGVSFELNRVQPLNVAPYYYLYPEKNYTYDYASGFIEEPYNITDGRISLCQMGRYDSALEACYSGILNYTNVMSSQSYQYFSTVINNDFNTEMLGGYNSETTNVGEPFMFSGGNIENDNTSICFPRYMGDTRFTCFSTTGHMDDYFLSAHINAGVYPVPAIIGELDGNYSSPELIFSNGDLESIRWNLTNYHLADWETTFTNAQQGNMWLQDISGDNRNELIYMDDTYFRVYSMNNTPATFLSYQYYTTASTTTTTAPGATTTTTNPDVPEIFNNLQNNIKPIIGLIIILFLCIITAAKTSSVIITVLAGIIGTVMSTFLGLLSSSIVVIMIIVLVVLMILGLTLFKNSGG